MNLSNLVHRHSHSTSSHQQSSNQQSTDPHRRLRHESRQDMATALTANPYISQSPVYTRPPLAPPSPPNDDPNSLRTLPSIQSLIGMDVGPSSQEQHCKSSLTDILVQLTRNAVDAEGNPIHSGGEHHNTGHRPQNYGQPTVSNPNAVPPSPPIDPQLGFDIPHQSPSAHSSHSSTSAQPYFASTMNTVEPHQQRQPAPLSSHLGANGLPPHPPQSNYQNSPYPQSPSVASSYSYPSPAHPAVSGGPSLFYQRALPNNFPPNMANNISQPLPSSQDGSPIDPNTNTPYQHQHHHYIAQSSSTNFTGQSQDRYVCPVCNKAFSRPSSLRIHSHSHTGEKPFLCPHKGCGKAFSVRSNMKRHERGCHGGASPVGK